MSPLELSNRWFYRERRRLLESVAVADAHAARQNRTVRSLRDASARPESERRAAVEAVERMLERLPREHADATRGDMQFYRAALEVLGSTPADALVAAAVQVEWLWYTSPFKKFYRDHLGHVMKVALTADELLVATDGPFARDGQTLLEQIGASLARATPFHARLHACARRLGVTATQLRDDGWWKGVVRDGARLAALLHDLAYPSIMATKVEHAAEVADPLALPSVRPSHACDRLIDEFGDRLVMSPFCRGELPGLELPRSAHAVVRETLLQSHSMQAGVRMLQFAGRADRLWRFTATEAFVWEWAALAAAMHDFDKLHELAIDVRERARAGGPLADWFADRANGEAIRIRYANDPLSWVVAMADQLQDFGRINYDFRRDGQLTAAIVVRRPVERVELRREAGGNTLAIRFVLSDGCSETERGSITRSKLSTAPLLFGGSSTAPWLEGPSDLNAVQVEVT